MWVKGRRSNLFLVFILFFKVQVEFTSSELNHGISILSNEKPVRANMFSKAASSLPKSKTIAGLLSC